MEIYIQHPAVHEGSETRVDVAMTPIHELPPTRGGLRRMAQIQITVPLASRAHKLLHAISESNEPMRLRTGRHVGMWSIVEYRLPGIPSDGQARVTLVFSGSAD